MLDIKPVNTSSTPNKLLLIFLSIFLPIFLPIFLSLFLSRTPEKSGSKSLSHRQAEAGLPPVFGVVAKGGKSMVGQTREFLINTNKISRIGSGHSLCLKSLYNF